MILKKKKKKVGTEPDIMDAMVLSIEESAKNQVFSQAQALQYVSSKLRVGKRANSRKSPVVRYFVIIQKTILMIFFFIN